MMKNQTKQKIRTFFKALGMTTVAAVFMKAGASGQSLANMGSTNAGDSTACFSKPLKFSESGVQSVSQTIAAKGGSVNVTSFNMQTGRNRTDNLSRALVQYDLEITYPKSALKISADLDVLNQAMPDMGQRPGRVRAEGTLGLSYETDTYAVGASGFANNRAEYNTEGAYTSGGSLFAKLQKGPYKGSLTGVYEHDPNPAHRLDLIASVERTIDFGKVGEIEFRGLVGVEACNVNTTYGSPIPGVNQPNTFVKGKLGFDAIRFLGMKLKTLYERSLSSANRGQFQKLSVDIVDIGYKTTFTGGLTQATTIDANNKPMTAKNVFVGIKMEL